jgi:hypothetical protein
MVYIYILKLKNNKYYIGKTSNPDFRLEEHKSGEGSLWTKKYKPIKVMELIKNCDSYDEDKYTLRYMELMGIDNVRGGSFCQLKLTNENRKTIERMINGSTDKCYKCGEKGHFANNCLLIENKKKLQENKECNTEVFCCKYCNKGFTSLNGARYHENIYCKMKPKKKSNQCSESEDDSDEEYTLDDLKEVLKEKGTEADGVYCFDGKKRYLWDSGELYEESFNSPGHKDGTWDGLGGRGLDPDDCWRPIKKKKTHSQKSNSGKCYRCGRNGHYSSNCYAKKHVKGYYL